MHEAQRQGLLINPKDHLIPEQAPASPALDLARRGRHGRPIAPRGGSSVRACVVREATCPRYQSKRLLDLAILTLVAMPALVIGMLSAMAILLGDGRPVLFRQVRVGRDGQLFVLLKLRTMTKTRRRPDAFPGPEDFTRAGRLLRRMSIDELPQLINVLRGEMSVVGPRPTLPYQVQRYDSRQAGRLRVQPGLTGLAQVNGRNRMSWAERIEWDLRYVANQSLRLDLAVLACTVRAILTGDGVAYNSRRDPITRI
jgi:sugar transferase EpsL